MEFLKPAWYHEFMLLGALSALSAFHESYLQTIARYLLTIAVARHLAKGVYNVFIYPYFFSPLRHIPGPKDHHFLLGDLINQARSGSPIEPYLSWTRRWADEPFIKFTGFGNADCLLVNSLEAYREIFQTKSYSFVKAQFNTRVVVQLAGAGMAFSEGDVHKSQRKLLSPQFALSNVKRAIPLFQSKAKELIEHFHHQIKAKDGITDVSSAYGRVTLDIVAWFTLGIDLGSTLSTSLFHEAFHKMFDPSAFGAFLMVMNAYIPGTRALPFEENREFNACSNRVRTRLTEIIRERVKEIDSGSISFSEKPDLLTHMILESRAIGDPWSESKILENSMNVMVAGHETSATTLTWATHTFTLYPHMQERARKEVLDLLARKPSPDYMDLDSLHYVDHIIKETLRLYAPGVLVAREPVDDIDVGGTVLPKGTLCYLFPALVTRSSRIWGDDVDEFNPDRWDRLTGEAANPHAFATFLVGPRQCIGRVFALLKIKVLLVEMLSNFRFEAAESPKDIVLVNPSPVLRPQGGLKIKILPLKATDV
ncbi:cytochrome P450 [Colletotrichum navitas]|uniref:Cytochrome P450 n=1 Tax=Colletotrichum navitas TaxID=681940 RepID=A0AAD8V6V0_9PEZI|nr:cytochrome P450 [Colletotrichum navitas]KAK1593720.1 cytochrome P450 [Colletotrichum navitas]